MAGIDLGRLIPSVLFGFFIFAAMTLYYVDMNKGFNSPVNIDNGTFSFENTTQSAIEIENMVNQNSTSTSWVNQFFPGIPLLFNIWHIIKNTTTGVVKDLSTAIDKFFSLVSLAGGGSALLVTLKMIFITVIVLSIVWIIIAALFRQGGFKQN